MGKKSKNYMPVGTVFEKNGRLYTVEESKLNSCHGCAFYNITSNGYPECKGISLPCDGDYREDRKNVVYKPFNTGEQC